MIRSINQSDYKTLIKIWESAVVQTHDFLKKEDFLFYKSMLPSYFENVKLFGFDIKNELVGFMGIHQNSLEMLFIHSECRGKGIGKELLLYGINEFNIDTVEVNEQNLQAVEFYKHMGFQVIGRMDKDGAGKNYPILKMKYPIK